MLAVNCALKFKASKNIYNHPEIPLACGIFVEQQHHYGALSVESQTFFCELGKNLLLCGN